jgi:hypothetical protein
VNPEVAPNIAFPSSSAVVRRQMWASARRPDAAPFRPERHDRAKLSVCDAEASFQMLSRGAGAEVSRDRS